MSHTEPPMEYFECTQCDTPFESRRTPLFSGLCLFCQHTETRGRLRSPDFNFSVPSRSPSPEVIRPRRARSPLTAPTPPTPPRPATLEGRYGRHTAWITSNAAKNKRSRLVLLDEDCDCCMAEPDIGGVNNYCTCSYKICMDCRNGLIRSTPNGAIPKCPQCRGTCALDIIKN